MALDATVGGANANSYVTVEEADSYFLERLHSGAWVTSTVKEAALITASRLLDWELVFSGSKALDAQAMQFPRSDLVLNDGTEVLSTIIPREIKFATFELALFSLSADRTADNPLAGIEMAKAGPLAIKATPAGYDSTASKVIPEHIRRMLADFIANGSISVVRLVRA